MTDDENEHPRDVLMDAEPLTAVVRMATAIHSWRWSRVSSS
jgi:hypothetical protein